MAASFKRFSRSAPEKPEVILATVLKFTSGAMGLLRACTLRICSLPLTSGRLTYICLSKRPGRISAGSRMSARLVAAITITPSFDSKPSIWTSIWLSVCSRSSLPPPSPAPLCLPTASISSMKIMQGWFFFAISNRSRTREAPTPTYISTKSEPETEKNGTPASPATALANSVLPVPGGPTKSTPLGILAPKSANFLGCFKNSTTSASSSFSSSAPATSVKRTLILVETRALVLAKDIALPAPPAVDLIISQKTTQTTIISPNCNTVPQMLPEFGFPNDTSTP